MRKLTILLPLIFILGCTSPAPQKPSCLYPPETPIHKRIKKAMAVAIPQNIRKYRYEIDGKPQEEDQLWNKVEARDDSIFTQVAITNIFTKGDKQKEYYALEQIVDLRDTTHRQPVIEYQFVVNPDTAYIRVADQKELRYTGISYEKIYLLEGFAHKGNPTPEQYRWWSPQFGDVMIWYGERRFLVLSDPLPVEIRGIIPPLKAKFQ